MLNAVETVSESGVRYFAFTFIHEGSPTLGVYSLELWDVGRKNDEVAVYADIHCFQLNPRFNFSPVIGADEDGLYGHRAEVDDELVYSLLEDIEGGS